MVANIRSGSSPGGALYYNKEKVDKDEAEVLFWQKMLEPFDKHGRMDVDACMDCFWPYLEANRRTTNTVFHASLNPSPEDRLTDDQLRDIAQEYMERMGYGNQPYIVFKHKDIDRIFMSYRCASMRTDISCRMISKQDVRWRYYAIWNANIICIRASRERSKPTRWDCIR